MKDRNMKRTSVNCKNERRNVRPNLVCKCSECRGSKDYFNKKLVELKRKHFRHFIQKNPLETQDCDDNSSIKEQKENTINPVDLTVNQSAVKGYFN